MAIRYINISISINGVNIENKEAIDHLVQWLRESTFACLMIGPQAEKFKFRNMFDSDIEIEIEETAGII